MDDLVFELHKSRQIVEQIQEDLLGLEIRNLRISVTSPKQPTPNEVYQALMNVSESLAGSYAQARRDIEDDTRITWICVAHEIREVLRNLLETLAPDENVTSQDWFKQEAKSGASHKQRAMYILKMSGSNSKAEDMIKKIEVLDELVSELVRDTYQRASAAAHSNATRKEARKILRYFDAFACDLLNI